MNKVRMQKRILGENEKKAIWNRNFFAKYKKLCLNLISSPGSGKTTLLCRTINRLGDRIKVGVIEGDVQTDIDAEKIRTTGAPVVQINTEGACHLSASQITKAMGQLPADDCDMIFIENVGNLVCPSAFELGETDKVAVLSVAEGDDKPAKYPAIFAKAAAMVINKTDLLNPAGMVDFDVERAKADARKVNKNIKFFELSAKTGDGFDPWCDWLIERLRSLK